MTRRPLTVVAVGIAVVCAVAAPAAAWVALSATTNVAASAGTVGRPTGLATSVTVADLDAGRVRLTWGVPAGPAPTGWQLERQAADADPAVWAVVSPTAAPVCSAGTCTALVDQGAPGGTFRYRVTALLQAWSGPASGSRLTASLTPGNARVAVDSSGLQALSVNGAGDRGLAVGAGGVTFGCAAACTGATPPLWRPGPMPTTADLRAVAFRSDTDAWAVGVGAVLHCVDGCSGTSPMWEENAAAEGLLGPRASTGVVAADGYVGLVADDAYLFSTDGGATWTDGVSAVGAPAGTALHAVAGPSGKDLLVTGSGGFAALCRTTTATCGQTDTFTPVTVPADLVKVTWDTVDGTYLAVDSDGVLWRGTPDASVTWTKDGSSAGAPGGIRGVAATTIGGAHHVWVVAPPGAGVGASTIWHHDGATWSAQPLHQPVASAVLRAVDGTAVSVPSSAAPTLPSTCSAPALVTSVAVPAGPAPAAGPDVLVRLKLLSDGGASALQLLGSTDGVTWAAPAAASGGGTSWSAALAAPTWDTTAATTLHVCVMARGGTGLTVDALRIGVQE